jgi:hypothetical protein
VTLPGERLWRVFPWDPAAPEGERFSATYVPPGQGKGRFDLPRMPGGVMYCAESPEHAVGEMIQHYRGQVLDEPDLRVGGHPLALVDVRLAGHVRERILDLCDPQVLVRLGLRPDETASNDRKVTQGITARVHAAGYAGLRWWSALTGDWHTVVLFRDRLDPAPVCGAPEPLTMDHPALIEAARTLGIRLGVP